ncbi:MAG: hypothetical protein OXU62_02830 [Gammaproteobacteria bacterium]|nr:hypothetical protein [Gammaproteobacteria bacterium]
MPDAQIGEAVASDAVHDGGDGGATVTVTRVTVVATVTVARR